MNEQNKIVKPLTMRKDDYIKSIAQLTNNSELPLFVIEYILKDLLAEIHNVSVHQAELDKNEYQKQIELLKNKNNGDTNESE